MTAAAAMLRNERFMGSPDEKALILFTDKLANP
jgi:hypothetical protein